VAVLRSTVRPDGRTPCSKEIIARITVSTCPEMKALAPSWPGTAVKISFAEGRGKLSR
jgi:hypothetical protein